MIAEAGANGCVTWDMLGRDRGISLGCTARTGGMIASATRSSSRAKAHRSHSPVRENALSQRARVVPTHAAKRNLLTCSSHIDRRVDAALARFKLRTLAGR